MGDYGQDDRSNNVINIKIGDYGQDDKSKHFISIKCSQMVRTLNCADVHEHPFRL